MTPEGRVICVRAAQPRNAATLMELRPEGRVICVRAVQPRKASLPMEVTPEGRAVRARAVQSQKAKVPMVVTPEGRAVWARAHPVRVRPSFQTVLPLMASMAATLPCKQGGGFRFGVRGAE